MEPSGSSRPLTSLRNIRGKVVCLLACKGHAGHFWMRLQQEVRQLLGIESRSLPNWCELWGVRTCLPLSGRDYVAGSTPALGKSSPDLRVSSSCRKHCRTEESGDQQTKNC